MRTGTAVRLVSVYPDLLGTYGDSGNLAVLAWRARRRGLDVESSEVCAGTPVPAGADVYLMGGGEDRAQALAAEHLRGAAGHGLREAVEAGGALLCVCAGLQVVGHSFPDARGVVLPGMGLLDVVTVRGPSRAVGEVVADAVDEPSLGRLSGYENHAGRTVLGPDAAPFARVVVGVGNSEQTRFDGARRGRAIGTYLHGPVLARNPDLADLLLRWAVGDLPPVQDDLPQRLRAERIAAAMRGRGATSGS